jgi:sugar phosphate isomerase/epimerase
MAETTKMHTNSINRRGFLGTAVAAGALGALPASAQPASPKGSFHLGSVTYNLLKDYDLETIIKTLEAVEFEAVELRTSHKHGVEPSISAAERTRVRRRFESSKVRLLSYGTTCRFQSPDPAERKQQLEIAKQFVDLAHDTGALGIKLQPMGLPPDVPQQASIEYFGASMRELGEYGAGRGVEIWMEVHGTGTQNPPVAAALLKAAGHQNVGACWNCNPTDVQNGSVKESFALLGKYIRNVHLHELSDDRYPFRELFSLLQQAGYDRYTLAEVAESKEPERYMRNFKALWTELKRSGA